MITKIKLYDNSLDVSVPLTEEFLIKLMIKNTLGILSYDECIVMIEKEKQHGTFDLTRSIISMMES